MNTPSSPTVRTLIERVVADTRDRLADVTTPSPAFAVALWSPDPGSLYPYVVLVGLESSRAAALSSMGPINAFDATWNAAEYGVEAAESELESDDSFACLEAAAREELEQEGRWDAQRYVLLRVAAELSLAPPLSDVTEDFVCFLFDGDMGEDLVTGIELSATEDAKRQLRAKRLLPSGMKGLGTYEEWRHEEQVVSTADVRVSAESPEAFDPLEGLEVAVSVTLDVGHVAAVFASGIDLCGAAPLPGVQEPAVIGRTAELSWDPYVIAGSLPRGAVRAQVRGGGGVWHDTQAGPGAWICMLATPLRGEVAVRYFNLIGDEVDLPQFDLGAGVPDEDEAIDQVWEQARRVLRGARVPLLWPRQVDGGSPELFGWSGDIDAADAVGLAGSGCRLWIGGEPQDVRELFAEHLIRDWNYEPSTAAKRAREVAAAGLPGSIADTPARFTLASPAESWMRDEGWTATVSVPGFTAAMTYFLPPPTRLDLDLASFD